MQRWSRPSKRPTSPTFQPGQHDRMRCAPLRRARKASRPLPPQARKVGLICLVAALALLPGCIQDPVDDAPEPSRWADSVACTLQAVPCNPEAPTLEAADVPATACVVVRTLGEPRMEVLRDLDGIVYIRPDIPDGSSLIAATATSAWATQHESEAYRLGELDRVTVRSFLVTVQAQDAAADAEGRLDWQEHDGSLHPVLTLTNEDGHRTTTVGVNDARIVAPALQVSLSGADFQLIADMAPGLHFAADVPTTCQVPPSTS